MDVTYGWLLALLGPAWAQNPVDIGVIREEDMRVVQNRLHPKDGRTELAFQLGLMPFDAYLFTPNVQLSLTTHVSERAGLTFVVGGGYGLPTPVYRTLSSPAYQSAPETFGYLGSFLWGIDYAPIYGKLNLNGARVVHFDAYLAKRFGVTVERSVLADGGLALGPTFAPALGARVFLGRAWALRVEVRDDLLIAWRFRTETLSFTQNANVTVGLGGFLGRGGNDAN